MEYKELYTFVEGEQVTIHSLGVNTPGEFRGRIRGISIDWKGPASIYIVELIDKIDPEYPFSSCTMPAACLWHGWAAPVDPA